MLPGIIANTSGNLVDQGFRTGEGFLKGDMDETMVSNGLDSLGIGDSVAGKTILNMLLPYVESARGKVIDTITNTGNQSIGASGLLSDSPNINKIEEVERQATVGNVIQPALEGVASGQVDEAVIKAHQNILGYSREEAEKKVASGGLGVAAMRGVANVAVGGVKESVTEASLEYAKGSRSPRDVADFAAKTQGAMYEADIKNNKFSGTTREDRNFLLKESVRSGAGDIKADMAARAANVVNKAADKAEGVANLRSIYGNRESSEALIDRMSALRGENVLAQRGDNFAKQTESLQQLKKNTGVSDQELSALTANSYKEISKFGGRSGLAQATAEATVRLTNGGNPTVSGLSKEEYAQNMTSFIADTVQRGDTRNVASAYRLWLDKNKEQNSSESFQKFQKETKDMDLTSSKGVYNFIKKTTGESGVAAQKTYHSVFNSEATKELEQDSNILAQATSKRLEDSSKGYVEEVKKAVGGEKQFKKIFGSEEEFKQKTPEDIRSTLMEKSNKLGGVGNVYKITDKIQGAAERSAAVAGMDTKAWQQAQISSKKSQDTASKDITGLRRYQELDRGKGLEGTARMLEDKIAKGEKVTPADIISQGMLGMNEEQVRAVSSPMDAAVMDQSHIEQTSKSISDTKRQYGLDTIDKLTSNSSNGNGRLETPAANPEIQGLTAIADPVNKILNYVQEIARRG